MKKQLVFWVMSLFLFSLLFFMLHDFRTNKTIIAVLDTGIKETKDIKKVNILNGFNFIDPFQKPIDKHGHGTEMAEIIHQMSPDTEILPVKVLSDKNTINHPFMALSILYSIIKGANVINMSFSYTSIDVFTSLMIKAGEAKGVVFVAAAGNDGKKTVDFPANQAGVIAVGSYDPITKKIAAFSNYSSKIDVFAPAGDAPEVLDEGTSMSAAFVTGIVADMVKNGVKKENIKNELAKSSDLLTQKKIAYKALNTDYAFAHYMKKPFMEFNQYKSFSTNKIQLLKMKTANLQKLAIEINNQKMRALTESKKLLVSLTYGMNGIRLIGYGANNLKMEKDAFILYDPKSPVIKNEFYVKNGIKYVLFTIQDLSLRKLEINHKRVVPLFEDIKDDETNYSYLMEYQRNITIEAEDCAGNRTLKKFS